MCFLGGAFSLGNFSGGGFGAPAAGFGFPQPAGGGGGAPFGQPAAAPGQAPPPQQAPPPRAPTQPVKTRDDKMIEILPGFFFVCVWAAFPSVFAHSRRETLRIALPVYATVASLFFLFFGYAQVKYRENWTLKDLPKPSVDAGRCASEALTHAHVTDVCDAKFNHDEVWVGAHVHMYTALRLPIDGLTFTMMLIASAKIK